MTTTDVDAALLDLARAVTAISLRAADCLDEASLVQLRALTLLASPEPHSLHRLAGRLGVTDSTASRLIDRLVAADLVDRRAAEHTRREVALRLTDHGQRVLDAYDAQRLEFLRAALTAVEDRDRPALLAGMAAISAAAARLDSG